MNTDKRSVVFVEVPGFKPIGSATILQLSAHGTRIVSVSDKETGIDVLKRNPDFLVFVTNSPDLELFEAARTVNSKASNILVTDLPMSEYTSKLDNRDVEVIDHIISNSDADWASSDLTITLQKIIRNDIFGIEKYLLSGTNIVSHVVKSSADRDPINQAVQSWIESCGLKKDMARLAYGISEELLMNAIYDAPVAGGRKHYEEMDRNAARNLLEDEWATLRYGFDGRLLAISIIDPFGAFPRDQWFKYMRKALVRNDPEKLIDTKKGGAGLGLFKMLYSSHGVICNVASKSKTEVAILILSQKPQRDFDVMPRSIHFFSSDNI